MSKLNNKPRIKGGGYATPSIDICNVKVEKGFIVSQNPNLSYGDEGGAGTIENGNSYEL